MFIPFLLGFLSFASLLMAAFFAWGTITLAKKGETGKAILCAVALVGTLALLALGLAALFGFHIPWMMGPYRYMPLRQYPWQMWHMHP